MTWYKDAVFYELRVRAFHDANGDGIGDFAGLTQKLDYLSDLGITALWLLPFYPSPLRDDGYDIADYCAVHPAVGTLEDFRVFVDAAHARGIRVVTELVLNHTSDSHAWFQRARRAPPGSTERDFYVWSDTPDRYADARIIFTDYENSNWAWDPVAKAYYWHRFFSHQPDLNFDNPEVARALFDVVDFWLELGVDGLRLDAVPYLFEREGTSSENLPETHAFLRALRRHVDERFPGRMLLAEANQWPEDAAAYFGDGDECHMAFHFPIMPRLFLALRMEDAFPILDILEQTPPIPKDAQWAVFLRNHDELTLEMVTDEERDVMLHAYAREPEMRVNVGIRRRLAPLLENNRRRLELMNALLFSLPGAPVLYYGDEIGMGDNIYLGDRNGVRTPMQWSPDRNAGFSLANPQRLFLPPVVDPEFHYQTVNVENQQRNPSSLLWWTKRLIALRRQYPTFGRGSFEPVQSGNRAVLAFVRRDGEERLLVVANLSRFVQAAALELGGLRGLVPVELFGGATFPTIGNGRYRVSLGPHDFYWFHLQSSAAPSPEPPPAPTLTVAQHWYELLEARTKAAPLEAQLESWIAGRRWFRGKTRKVRVRVAGSVELDAVRDTRLVMLEATQRGGSPDVYLIALRAAREAHEAPLALVRRKGSEWSRSLVEVSDDPELGKSLLALARAGRRTKAPLGTLVGSVSPEVADQTIESARRASADQSNTCFLLGNDLVCKLVRCLEGGPSVEVEVLRALAPRAAELGVPELLGSLDLLGADGTLQTLASFTRFIPNQGSAWQLTLDEIRRFFEQALVRRLPPPAKKRGRGKTGARPDAELLGAFAEIAERLGRRTAELHLALAACQHPDFVPKALSARAEYQGRRTLTARSLDLLERELPRLPEQAAGLARTVLRKRREIQSRIRLGSRSTGIRVHGDYHLGQVLFTGKDFAIVDFEGEPARSLADRRRRRPALTDVAGMLRSFQYALQSVLSADVPTIGARPEDLAFLAPWGERWLEGASAAFVAGYLARTADSGLVPADAKDLQRELDVCLLEKALYEVAYELDNRPAWVSVPLTGLVALLERGSGRAGDRRARHET
ncbi:MAG: trehalose synthase [Polyangiaceae bacterium]